MIAQALASPEPTVCWRCEMIMTRDEIRHADLGHVVDIGYETPDTRPRLKLEHPGCNRAAGIAAQRERVKRPTRPPSTAWQTGEL